MPNYTYKATNTAGQTVTGKEFGENPDQVSVQLRRRNLNPVEVKEVKKGFLSFGLGGAGKKKKRVKAEELVVFSRQLATMISAGIPLLECLEVLGEQTENPGFKARIDRVVEDVRGGNDLSASLAKHPKVFQKIYVSMVRAGEASGQLDVILDRLAGFIEASAKLKSEIKSAMTYPVISLFMVFGITIFLMVGIVPKFKEIFDSMNITLPWITKTLLNVSIYMKENFLVLMGALGGGFAGFTAFIKSNRGEWLWHWAVLRSPIFGNLFQKVALSRFSRTFATLIQSGVPILGALEIVATTAGNRLIEDAINDAVEAVREGNPLYQPLASFWVFPPMVVKMISIGERSGSLEKLLEKIAEFYDQQVSAAVEALTSMIEPILIGVMGLIVGAIVLAIFLPILELQKALTSRKS